MACEDTRQLTEAQRQAAYQQQRTGVPQAIRPFTGSASLPNLIDYINRELMPAVRQSRSAVNDVYLQVVDNAPSANPLGYYFSTETASGDPTTGRVRLNASPQSSATNIAISQTNGRLVDVLPWLDVMNGSVTVPLGVVTLADAINPGRFLRADLNTMVDQGAYWDLGITITEASHPNPFVDAEAVTLAFIPGVADNGGLGAQIPPGSIAPIATDTFLGNISGATASPVAVALASVDSTSITYDGTAHEFRRAALTGFAAAAANTNATTSAEPIVTFSASANMSNERVLSNGTGTTIDIGTAGQVQVDISTPLTDGDKGDITVSSNGTVWTIDDNVVDDDKLRNSVGPSVIGRASATTGNPSDIIAATNDRVLARVANALDYVQVGTTLLADASVTPIKIAPGVHTLAGAGPHTDIAIADTVTTILCETTTTINSIAGGWNSRRLSIITDGGNTLNVNHGIGAAGNQIALPDAVSYSQLRGGMLIEHDTSTGTGVWRIVATAEGLVPLARMDNLAESRILGRAEGAGTGPPTALTPTQTVAIIDAESPTWTGSHSFTGADFTVDVTDDVSVEAADALEIRSGASMTVAATGTAIISSSATLALTGSTAIELNGSTQTFGSLTVGGALRLAGVISPTIAADTNNWAPTGLSGANIIRVDNTAASELDITGLTAQPDGTIVTIFNVSGAIEERIRFRPSNGSSSAANQFLFATVSLVLVAIAVDRNQSITFWYDGTTDRWRLVSHTGEEVSNV